MAYQVKLHFALILISLIGYLYGKIILSYQWTAWTAWPTSCSTTCSVGRKCRIRKCQNSLNFNVDNKNCKGKGINCTKCRTNRPCPKDSYWTIWTQWSLCSHIPGALRCGDSEGIRRSDRRCVKARYGGRQLCSGNQTRVRHCSVDCKQPDFYLLNARAQIQAYITKVRNNIIRRPTGNSVLFDCNTRIYRTLMQSFVHEKQFKWLKDGFPMFKQKMVKKDALQQPGYGKQQKKQKLKKDEYILTNKMTESDMERFKLLNSYLEINNLRKDDSGIYTCVSEYDKQFIILAAFYVLIVGETVITKHSGAKVPFEPYVRAFSNHDIFDDARIQWYLNNEPFISRNDSHELNGLAMQRDLWNRAIYVTIEHKGLWQCFLIDTHTQRRWLTNEFVLRITQPITLTNRLSRDVTLFSMLLFAVILTVLIWLGFCITADGIRRDEKRKLSPDRVKDIIHEEIQNYIRLFMVVKPRAFKKTDEIIKTIEQTEEDLQLINVIEGEAEQLITQQFKKNYDDILYGIKMRFLGHIAAIPPELEDEYENGDFDEEFDGEYVEEN